jgi:hypothetical protein
MVIATVFYGNDCCKEGSVAGVSLSSLLNIVKVLMEGFLEPVE